MDALEMQQAAMLGAARYAEWKRQFLDQWTQSMKLQAAKALWIGLPPEVKEKLRREHPEQYKQAQEIFS